MKIQNIYIFTDFRHRNVQLTSKLSIIIVNWNGVTYLKSCLISIFDQSYNNFKVILVDNGSTDNSVDFVTHNFPAVKIIALDSNSGFVRGNNIGIKYALEKNNSEYVLLLNNDTQMIRKDFLEKLIEVADNDKKIGILGCKIIFPDGRNSASWHYNQTLPTNLSAK